MLGMLIKKEITETVLDFRFVIVTLLCVVLIPLGMYVSRTCRSLQMCCFSLYLLLHS